MSTMQSKRRPEEGVEQQQPPEDVVDRLAELLPDGALDEAVRGLKPEELSGPGGLLSQLAGRVVEAALEAEMTEHLGHPPGGTPAEGQRPQWPGPPRSRGVATVTQARHPLGGPRRQGPRALRGRHDRPRHLSPSV